MLTRPCENMATISLPRAGSPPITRRCDELLTWNRHTPRLSVSPCSRTITLYRTLPADSMGSGTEVSVQHIVLSSLVHEAAIITTSVAS